MRIDRRIARGAIIAAAFFPALNGVASAQFVMDAERQVLRQAAGRATLEDMPEGESRLVPAPLAVCVMNGALFIPAHQAVSETPAQGAYFRIERLPDNAAKVETVSTDEAAFPRLELALDTMLSGLETDCTRLPMPEAQLYRISTMDGADKASQLLERAGVNPQATTQPAAPPPHAWKITQATAEDGKAEALLATLTPRTPSNSEFDDVSPRLAMRCENGALSAFVTSSDIIWDKRPEVTLRIDNGPVATYRWLASEDGRSVGLWTGEEARTFMNRLADNGTLFLRLRDRNLIYVEFDLANAREATARILNACPA